MLQSRIRASLAKRADPNGRESGFTLVELLVVMIIIGLLSAIAIPVFLDQRKKAFDTAVVSDLRNLTTAAETTFATRLKYEGVATTFATNGTAPIVTKDTTYVAFTNPTGSKAGYVIFGKNLNSDIIWVTSSYDGGAPVDSLMWTAGVAVALPTAPPATADMVSKYGAPSGTTLAATAVTFAGKVTP